MMDGFLATIEQTESGCIRFRIRVTPRAKQPGIGGVHDGSLKIAVSEAPEGGKANKAVIRALAKRLRVSPSSIEIVSGQTGRIKTVVVSGITSDEARRHFSD